MYIQLDGQGPRYARPFHALKAAILESRIAAGARVRASRALASELGISRNTVIAAYDQWQAEGFLVSRVGAGSFVAEIGNRIASIHESGESNLVSPLSDFARRALLLNDGTRIPGRQHRDSRYNLQYGLPLTNTALASA